MTVWYTDDAPGDVNDGDSSRFVVRRRSRSRGPGPAEGFDGERSVGDILGDVGEAQIVAPSVMAKSVERLVGADSRALGDDALGLFDHDSTVECFVELLVYDAGFEPDAMLQDRDRGDVGECLRGEDVGIHELTHVSAEQVERTDDVRVRGS